MCFNLRLYFNYFKRAMNLKKNVTCNSMFSFQTYSVNDNYVVCIVVQRKGFQHAHTVCPRVLVCGTSGCDKYPW